MLGLRSTLLLVSWFVLPVGSSVAGPTSQDAFPGRLEPRLLEAPTAAERGLGRAATSHELAFFDFDGPIGPDAQGWTAIDRSAPPASHWHVDDFVGLGPGYAPLGGTKSLWCGSRPLPPGSGETMHASLPGYGSGWREWFEGGPFTGGPGFTLVFDARWDMEPDYDWWTVEALYDPQIGWVQLDFRTATGSLDDHSIAIPAPSGSQVSVRFSFRSDASIDDQDGDYDSNGAVVIDDIRIVRGGVTIHSEDFEDEAVGATVSTDGTWRPWFYTPYGQHASLFDGGSVRQDGTSTNASWFWGFFANSTEWYRCGQDLSQRAVPSQKSRDYPEAEFLHNEVRSPWIPLDPDPSNPLPADLDGLTIEFDVYGDLPVLDWLFFQVVFRFRVDGEVTAWSNDTTYYYREEARWHASAIEGRIPAGADDVQVGLIARDASVVFGQPSVICHPHGPLFDDVRITRNYAPEQPILVTTTQDFGAGSLREAILAANASPDPDRIVFDFSLLGTPATITTSTPLPKILYATVIDGTSEPSHVNDPVVFLRPLVTQDNPTGLTLGDDVTLLDVGIYGFPSTNLRIEGRGNTVQGCWFGKDPSGGPSVWYQEVGVRFADGAHDNLLGGTGSSEGNRIEGHFQQEVLVEGDGSFGNAIRGNEIKVFSAPAIDLGGDGLDTNDVGDADTGPNGRQNHPVIEFANGGAGRVRIFLPSAPDTDFEIDLFENHVSGRRAENYLGSITGRTDAQGRGEIEYGGVIANGSARHLTATATDASGNTSEISPSYRIPDWIGVTNTANSGLGSLRDAMLWANGRSGPVVIDFDVPGEGPHTIAPTSALPILTTTTMIDGFGQPGGEPNGSVTGLNADLRITIDGTGVTGDGIVLRAPGSGVQGLAIGGFSGSGVRLQGTGQWVRGCFVGLDASGFTQLGNGQAGIRTDDAFSTTADVEIGGPDPGDRNLVAGNGGSGILVMTQGGTVEGNWVGVDRSGTTAVPNLLGIEINGPSSGFSDVRGNLASGNLLMGVQIGGPDCLVEGNRLGVDAVGGPLGNGTFGLFIAADDTRVAGSPGNVIAHNGFDGVRIALGQRNRIFANSIFDNGQLGIDVEPDGVTPLPTGSYAPIPTLWVEDASTDVLGFTAQGTPLSSLRVDFYVNEACDPSGHGEGKIWIGSTIVAADPSGIAAGTFSPAQELVGGEMVTATTTDVALGTSEFSLCVPFFNTVEGSNVVAQASDGAGGVASVTLTFASVSAPGQTTATETNVPAPITGNFVLGNGSVVYDVTTTATYSGSIEICLGYDPAGFTGPESELALLHYDAAVPGWVDVTTSVDELNDTVCGVVDGLSPFVVVRNVVPTDTGITPSVVRTQLHPAAPNPFNPRTTLRFDLAASGEVRLSIHDVAGRKVRDLVAGSLAIGRHSVVWDGRDANGRPVASGLYLVRFDAPGRTETEKIVLVK